MLLVCNQIQGVTSEDLEKLKSSGSFASVTELTPESIEKAQSSQLELIALARKAEERASRNAKISAAIAVGSFAIAVASFLFNYHRAR